VLKETAANSVTFADLVEHPGGHDGGEFVRENTYKVLEDGTLLYNASVVTDQHNVFGDEPAEDLLEVSDVDEARQLLRTRLASLELDLVNLRAVVAAFDAQPGPLVLCLDDEEVSSPDEDEDEDEVQ